MKMIYSDRMTKNTGYQINEKDIEKIPRRKGHDFRYSINGSKFNSLGFRYKHRAID